MTRVRIPIKDFRAKDKHKYIPEGEREVGMIFAPEVLFIDTAPIKPEAVEEPKEPKTPDTTWSKKKLIKEAKRVGAYSKDMEDRKYTKAQIVEALKTS